MQILWSIFVFTCNYSITGLALILAERFFFFIGFGTYFVSGNLNPALIAALNQASWELMNGSAASAQSSPVPPPPTPLNGNYPSPLASGSSPSRQYSGGYGGAGNQYRENWWNNGYSNSRQNGSFNKSMSNTSAFFTRRKNYM